MTKKNTWQNTKKNVKNKVKEQGWFRHISLGEKKNIQEKLLREKSKLQNSI